MPRHLVTENIYQISKFNSCCTVTTLQGLETISELFADFNIIVTGLVSCLIKDSECMLNAPLRRRKFKKKF